MTPFRVLVADPPWKFKDRLPGKTRGAARRYPCLTVSEIMRFPLPPIADDALLCLWRVGAMQKEAMAVAEAWGFRPVQAEMVWDKLTALDASSVRARGLRRLNRALVAAGLPPVPRKQLALVGDAYPEDALDFLDALHDLGVRDHFGMGRLVRASHEVCLLAVRGRFKRASAKVRSRFAAPVGEHSAKPAVFYERVEQLAGAGPYAELFARRHRPGWTCFGNELEATP